MFLCQFRYNKFCTPPSPSPSLEEMKISSSRLSESRVLGQEIEGELLAVGLTGGQMDRAGAVTDSTKHRKMGKELGWSTMPSCSAPDGQNAQTDPKTTVLFWRSGAETGHGDRRDSPGHVSQHQRMVSGSNLLGETSKIETKINVLYYSWCMNPSHSWAQEKKFKILKTWISEYV